MHSHFYNSIQFITIILIIIIEFYHCNWYNLKCDNDHYNRNGCFIFSKLCRLNSFALKFSTAFFLPVDIGLEL